MNLPNLRHHCTKNVALSGAPGMVKPSSLHLRFRISPFATGGVRRDDHETPNLVLLPCAFRDLPVRELDRGSVRSRRQ